MLKSGEYSPDRLKLGQTPVSSTLTWPNLDQIPIDTKEYWPNLFRSDQIWRDPARFRPKSGEITKPKTDRLLPKTQYDLTWLIWNFPWVGCGLKFYPPEKVRSGQVWVGHKLDLARPVDTPSGRDSLTFSPWSKAFVVSLDTLPHNIKVPSNTFNTHNPFKF